MSSAIALNLFALFLLILVSAAVIIGNYKRRGVSFYVLVTILLIPAFAQGRQLLALYDLLKEYPLYLVLVYILLRLIGPLINYLVHLQLRISFNFFSTVNLITYGVFGYIIFISFKYLFITEYTAEELLITYQENHLLAATYPVLQLMHVGQALYLLHKFSKKEESGLIYFVKVGVTVVAVTLIGLQIGYFVFDRSTVEFFIGPAIFIVVYTAILFISVKYSSLFATPKIIAENEALTERENEVMQRLVAGKTDKEIAEELHLSTHTIATYCRRIYAKLEVKNRTEAARKYLS